MAEDNTRPGWGTAFGSALVSVLSAVSLPVPLYRPPRTKTLPFKKLALRIDVVPADMSTDVFQRDLRSIVDSDPDLKERVTSIEHHFLVRRDQRMACATATFCTSLDARGLIAELHKASVGYPYIFDVHFRGITPLYEDPAGANVE